MLRCQACKAQGAKCWRFEACVWQKYKIEVPIFKWEEAKKTAVDISKWVDLSPDKTSILFCYSLGKAQRLLNEIKKTNFKNKIYTHTSIDKMNNCYKKLGIDKDKANPSYQ